MFSFFCFFFPPSSSNPWFVPCPHYLCGSPHLDSHLSICVYSLSILSCFQSFIHNFSICFLSAKLVSHQFHTIVLCFLAILFTKILFPFCFTVCIVLLNCSSYCWNYCHFTFLILGCTYSIHHHCIPCCFFLSSFLVVFIF